jgi:oligo-alginate lyase
MVGRIFHKNNTYNNLLQVLNLQQVWILKYQKMKHWAIIIGLLTTGILRGQSSHPNLLITPSDVKLIKGQLGKYPLFDKAFKDLQKQADKALVETMDVPIPKDPAGAYTHERHTKNYKILYAVGMVYATTKDKKYSEFVRTMLLQYAALIPTLKNHPQAKSSSPGRLFHQALNDCNWIVQAIQGYDAVYDALSTEDRKTIENGVFRPLTSFLTKDLESWFNLIHNHGVWAVAAVGMTGYALQDKNLVEIALKGTKNDGKGGFLAQLDQLFSPDGYYAEGPYYTRYALMPFYLLALTIENNEPPRKIFDYRNQILKKAFYGALQLTYTNGAFFPFNDAMKDKDWTTQEMVFALNIAFSHYGKDETLLSVAREQGRIMFSRHGLEVAKAMAKTPNLKPFQWTSTNFTDGASGTEGGLSTMRYGEKDDQICLVFKYGAHGLSHGHFDKLNYFLYDQNQEILPDYGAARFLNVEQKYGGRYLPENNTYAMQTVAHNTVVVDETSQYNGKEAASEVHHASLYFQDITNKDCQIVSAYDNNAYKNVGMKRTVALIRPESATKPFVLDVYKITANEPHQYDLPMHYLGHLIATNFEYKAFTDTRKPVGKKAGYQHLWLEAQGRIGGSTQNVKPKTQNSKNTEGGIRNPKPETRNTEGVATVTFLTGNRYYSISTTADTATEILLTRIGANDPNFNLRNEAGFIIRKKAQNQVFASVIEPHGNYDGKNENSTISESQIERLEVLKDDEKSTIVALRFKKGKDYLLCLANDTADKTVVHSVEVEGKIVSWTGVFSWQQDKN